MSPCNPALEDETSDQQWQPQKSAIRRPKAPARAWNQVRSRRLPELHVQNNGRRQRGDNRRPEHNPAPSGRHRNGIVEYVAMPPLRLVPAPGIGASTLEARGANVLSSQLQVAQRAQKTPAPLAASLEGLLWVKETGRLLRHRGDDVHFLLRHRPDAHAQLFGAIGTDLPSARRGCRGD